MNIEKPQKRKLEKCSTAYLQYDKGYNHACSDWEKFLPSEEEISKIIKKWFREYWDNVDGVIKEFAKAISQRIK